MTRSVPGRPARLVLGLSVFVIATLLSVSTASAQTWTREFDMGGTVAVDDDGSIVLVGNRSATFTPSRQLVVTLLEPSGAIVTSTVVGFEYDDRADQVAFLDDGAIAIAVRHRLEGGHLGPSDPNLAVVVLERDLTLRWRRMLLATASFDYAPRLIARDDGGVVLVGDADPDLSGDQDLWVVAFDAAGEIVAQRAWDTGASERPFDVVALPDGGFAVAGMIESAFNLQDAMLARFDADLDLVWLRRYGVFAENNSDRGRAVAASPDGALYLAGVTASYGGVADDWLIVKTDGDGVVQWSGRVDGARGASSTYDTLWDVVADESGVVLAGGRPRDQSTRDPWAMRLDPDGNWLWSRVWAVPDDNVDVIEVHAVPEVGWLFSTQGSQIWTGPGRLIRTDVDGAIGTDCDSGNYNAVFPLAVEVEVEVLAPDMFVTDVEASAEPWYENDETYGAQAICIGPPGEVSRPGSPTPLTFASADRLVWEAAAASNAATFDLYRGDLADLAAGLSPDCLVPDLVVPEAVDMDVPLAGDGYGYLVGARNAAGRGTLGRASDGTERPNGMACP